MIKYIDTTQFIDDYKQYLTDNGITHAHIARRIGISPQQLQNIYRKRELTISDVQALCNAINCQCDVVITRIDTGVSL